MIRPATPHDVEKVVALGVEALEKHGYEGLVISRERCRNVAVECISGASHFAWVAEEAGEIVAAVLALVHPLMFYERNQATVVQFYSKRPGAGIKLLRQFLTWARGRRAIKSIVFTVEHEADPRIGKLLQRLGLKLELPVYMETR